MTPKMNAKELSKLWIVLPLVVMAITLAAPARAFGDTCIPITQVKVTVNPSTMDDGQPTPLTLTFTLNTPVTPCNTNGGDAFQIIWGAFAQRATGSPPSGDCWIGLNLQGCTFKFTTYGFSPDGKSTRVAFIVGQNPPAYLDDIVTTTPSPEPPANLGFCKQCQEQTAQPVNITTGNVWIPQTDYTVPGLGGGLILSRTWNSRWQNATPPSVWGMFGFSWRSTYEEQLLPVNSQTLQYWRGDGSAWTFSYNAALNSYTLVSPPDERAQLVSSPAGGFILTFADHTQRIFNGDDYLSTIIDRNGNQTTVSYDAYDRITSVTGANGATLTFTYGDANNPLQATTVQDTVGTIATYTYDSLSRLTSVTYADGNGYNFASDPNTSMILSVTDSQNKLIESHTYDSTGRGLTSARAYGVDSVSLTY